MDLGSNFGGGVVQPDTHQEVMGHAAGHLCIWGGAMVRGDVAWAPRETKGIPRHARAGLDGRALANRTVCLPEQVGSVSRHARQRNRRSVHA
eukprot:scaffold113872_cov35-Tisochrysis_lutea.AAC.3